MLWSKPDRRPTVQNVENGPTFGRVAVQAGEFGCLLAHGIPLLEQLDDSSRNVRFKRIDIFLRGM